MSDDDWGEEPTQEKVSYEVAEVIQDYVPETNAHLPLFKYERVYVFKKLPNGLYEGEREGIFGVFPSQYVKIIKEGKQVAIKSNLMEK